MKTLSENLNFSRIETEHSHKLRVTETVNISAYDTLCLICAELDIDVGKYKDTDFDSASMVLETAYLAAQNDIKTTDQNHIDLYVWID